MGVNWVLCGLSPAVSSLYSGMVSPWSPVLASGYPWVLSSASSFAMAAAAAAAAAGNGSHGLAASPLDSASPTPRDGIGIAAPSGDTSPADREPTLPGVPCAPPAPILFPTPNPGSDPDESDHPSELSSLSSLASAPGGSLSLGCTSRAFASRSMDLRSAALLLIPRS